MTHLLVDLREKATVQAVNAYHEHIEWTTLVAGDFACSCGCAGWERKEDDLDNMGGVLTQINELKQYYPNAYLMVTRKNSNWVNDGRYAPRLNFIASCTVRGLPIHWCHSYSYMLDLIHAIIRKLHDGKYRGDGEFSTVRHVKKKDQSLNVLTSLPGIGRGKAEAILKEFGSVGDFLDAEPSDWTCIPGIGIKTCDLILDALYREE